jgi:hypothetical protein
LPEGGEDRSKDPVQIIHDVPVAQPQNAKTTRGKRLIAAPIGVGVVRVAIDFHDQPSLRAQKIGDIPADYCLPAELVPLQLATRQRAPQTLFRFGGVAAHVRRALIQFSEGPGR